MEKAIIESVSVLRPRLETEVAAINELLLDSASIDEVNKAITKADETAKELNKSLVRELFVSMRETERPMLTAIETLVVAKVNIREVEDKETKAIHYEINDGKKLIDLVAFVGVCRVNGVDAISHKGGWQYRAEVVAKLLAARVTKEIGGDEKELMKDFRLSKKAAEAEKKETVPYSNKQLTKELQELVDMILFDDNGEGKSLNKYKVTSQDIAFLLALACKPGKNPKTVTMPQGKTIINLITQIINRIVTGDTYAALYKRAEEQKAAEADTDKKAA